MTREIWDVYGIGFGDLWATLNWVLRLSESNGRQFVSSYHGDRDIKTRMLEMMDCLDATGCEGVDIVDDAPTMKVGGRPWSTKYVRTNITWDPARCFGVSHQLDGKSSDGLKNPPEGHLLGFKEWASSKRYPVMPVGLPYSIDTCVRILANSSAFIGVCSGMSHLAHSVGVPVFLVEYQLKVAWWHGPNPYILCDGLPVAQRRIDEHLSPKGGNAP